jgi:hypothetical protein
VYLELIQLGLPLKLLLNTSRGQRKRDSNKKIRLQFDLCRSRGSSVSIVLTADWTTWVQSPTEAEDFCSSICVQTGSGAHPASCPVGTGVKRGRGLTLTTHPYLVPRLRMSTSSSSPHPKRLHGV